MSAHLLQILIEVELPSGGGIYRYQNFQSEDFTFQGETYTYLGFQVESYPESALELSGQGAIIWIRNIDPVPSLLRQQDGLRRALVTIIHVLNNGPPVLWRLQVFSSTPTAGYVAFTLNTPTSALQGAVVTRYINSQDHPELVFVNPQQVRL